MKNSIYAVCLLMLVISSSCRNRNEKKIEANNIDFKEYVMDTTYHLFGDTIKPSIKINLSTSYPVEYKNKSVLDSLQRLIITSITGSSDQTQRNPEEVMRNFISQKITEYIRQVVTDELYDSFPNEYVAEESNVFYKDNIFCFSTGVYNFTGGAHGVKEVKNICVNLNNGSIITNRDLFTMDNSESLLTSIILEKLTEMQKVKSPVDLEKNGFFDISAIRPNDNFLLNEKGITYVYNPYEIAAYYIGILEVFIPYEDIIVILAPQSPIKQIVNK